MDAVPGYVSVVFLVTTFAAVWFLLQAAKAVGLQTFPSKILLFLLPLWIIFQCVLSIGGFYQKTDSLPPRLFLFGVLPSLVLIISFFLFFRASFIERLPLKLITLLHVVRIPVEMVLYWLFIGSQVPRAMTFAGWNYDIASGILALLVYEIAFRGNAVNKSVLVGFNLLGLLLLVNIVSIAVLSLPSPIQQLAFDQPNRAVLTFPYALLPTIVVPIVLFAHLAALWKLSRDMRN
ncbi:MAG: hypothetical protein ABL999_11975 [Pyrinomonadaceae bacterium]